MVPVAGHRRVGRLGPVFGHDTPATGQNVSSCHNFQSLISIYIQWTLSGINSMTSDPTQGPEWGKTTVCVRDLRGIHIIVGFPVLLCTTGDLSALSNHTTCSYGNYHFHMLIAWPFSHRTCAKTAFVTCAQQDGRPHGGCKREVRLRNYYLGNSGNSDLFAIFFLYNYNYNISHHFKSKINGQNLFEVGCKWCFENRNKFRGVVANCQQ